jgi:hypothetical protein
MATATRPIPARRPQCGPTGARRLERNRRARVARVLDDRAVARIEQQARDEVEALLRAVDDDDLLRVAGEAARPVQVFGKRLAQWRVPCG